jgi:hypothetical protein
MATVCVTIVVVSGRLKVGKPLSRAVNRDTVGPANLLRQAGSETLIEADMMTFSARRLAEVGVACAAALGCLIGPGAAAAAPLRPTAINPQGQFAGYYRSNLRVSQLGATIVVPRMVCRSAEGYADITVTLGNKRQVAFGSISMLCLAKGKPWYGVSLYAGRSSASLVRLFPVRPGRRVAVELTDRDGRLTAKLTVAGRHRTRVSAGARRASSFEIGAIIEGRSSIRTRPFRVTDAAVNAQPLGDVRGLRRTSQILGKETLLVASRLRHDMAFTVTEP